MKHWFILHSFCIDSFCFQVTNNGRKCKTYLFGCDMYGLVWSWLFCCLSLRGLRWQISLEYLKLDTYLLFPKMSIWMNKNCISLHKTCVFCHTKYSSILQGFRAYMYPWKSTFISDNYIEKICMQWYWSPINRPNIRKKCTHRVYDTVEQSKCIECNIKDTHSYYVVSDSTNVHWKEHNRQSGVFIIIHYSSTTNIDHILHMHLFHG